MLAARGITVIQGDVFNSKVFYNRLRNGWYLVPLILGGFEINDSQQQNQYHIGQKLNATFTMLKREAPNGFVGNTLQKLRAFRRHKDHRYFQIFWRAELFPYLWLKGSYRLVIPILCKP
ncbi:MAG TPA: hypothetical protein DCS89_05105 [Gammaproteobacteria bacterium]|nr:hypothetical protein [Gammaproteobacteria bacterium]